MKRILFITGLLGVMGMLASPVRSVIGGRNTVLAKGESLPYDAEVEYLESDGNQYVQTCITGKDFAEGSVAIEGMPLSLLHSFPVFAGCIPQDSFGFFGVHNNVTQLYSRLSASASLFGFASDYSVLSNRYLMTVGGGKNVLYADDGTILDEKDVRRDIVPPSAYPNRLGLFGYGNGLRIMNGRIYSAKVWDVNGAVIGDFIPVRFTNELGQSEGAMYDRVSGQLFRNAGTGAFLFGQDKH